MLSHGAQLEAIRRLLGHESVVTTSIYTHTTVAELRKQYAAAHPHDRAEKGSVVRVAEISEDLPRI